MKTLIGRCLLTEPSARPSFDDISREFTDWDFHLFEQTDSGAVAKYVSGIKDVETLGRIEHFSEMEHE
jgi:hypothetical protein